MTAMTKGRFIREHGADFEGTFGDRIANGEAEIRDVIDLSFSLHRLHVAGTCDLGIFPSSILRVGGKLEFSVSRPMCPSGSTDDEWYLAPEEVSGCRENVRSDIWHMGVLAYTVLTGRTPCWSEDEGPDVSGLPRCYRDVVGKALSTDPSDRYGSAADFADALVSAAERASGYVPLDWRLAEIQEAGHLSYPDAVMELFRSEVVKSEIALDDLLNWLVDAEDARRVVQNEVCRRARAEGPGGPTATWVMGFAERGNAIAQTMLANLYRIGAGVPKDCKVSDRWLEQAAMHGDAIARFDLAARNVSWGAPDRKANGREKKAVQKGNAPRNGVGASNGIDNPGGLK